MKDFLRMMEESLSSVYSSKVVILHLPQSGSGFLQSDDVAYTLQHDIPLIRLDDEIRSP